VNGPDVEGVLRDHVVHGGSSGGRWNADCLAVGCHWSAHGETGGFWETVEAHRAHVAAAVRAEVRAWLESEGAVRAVAIALHPGEWWQYADQMGVEVRRSEDDAHAALAALAEQVGQVASVGEGEG
jgi:hypothetical protein